MARQSPLPCIHLYTLIYISYTFSLDFCTFIYTYIFLPTHASEFLFKSDESLSKHPSSSNACFLFEAPFKTDEHPLWSIPSLLKYVPCSILIRSWWTSSLKHLSSSKACFLFSSYSKFMKILSDASLLFQSTSLIQCLFEMDENHLRTSPD